MILKRLGKSPSGNRLKRIENTSNFRNGRFYNVEPTSINPKDVSAFTILKEIRNRPKSVRPLGEIPHKKTNLCHLKVQKPSVVWFGHSSYYLSFSNFNVLVDPVICGNASPVWFLGKPFKGTDVYKPEDFPEIDLLLITHDHYDHLDYRLIKRIKSRIKLVITSLGVGEHLEYWGVQKEQIRELSWQESFRINSHAKITALPARHFSGRGFKRFNTLWSSFVLQWEDFRIYIGGDSGYSRQFKEIGEQFQGFDIAFLECGQYGKYWPQIHMFPEETVQAAKDLNAKVLFPVHWGKFVLSTHPWNEPVNRLFAAAKKRGQNLVVPLIGEAYSIGDNFEQPSWWNFE